MGEPVPHAHGAGRISLRVGGRRASGSDREHGAVLAMTALIMVVLIAAAAFAVDAGNLWSSRRRLRTSTDAASLAAAKDYAEGVDGCAGIDDTYATANDPGATVTDCHDHPNGDAGYVTVAAERTVGLNFAGIFGFNTATIGSTTHAMYGIPTGANGMRPMGLCAAANAELVAWLNLPQGPSGDSGTIRVYYTKDHPDACGGEAPGNWGMLDFNGGDNSNAETKEWVSNGYPETVPLSPPSIPGDTGSFNPSIDTELAGLLNKQFALPIFATVTGTGSNATFDVVAFVWVKLVGYRVNGSESDRYLDLQFQANQVIQGTCCGNGGPNPDTGARAVRICATDPGHDEACVSEDGT
ncbi:MAG: pilus assembly protein TadG-related protein [Actinomycetota bacterium]